MNSNTKIDIALLGGGRWGRVLAGELIRILPPDSTIRWVTKHDKRNREAWIAEHGQSRMLHCKSISQALPVDIAIVANRPEGHVDAIRDFLNAGVNVLTEKPLSLSADDATELIALAKRNRLVFGVNLLFTYASYLNDFASKIDRDGIRRVLIEWCDPWVTDRYGEIKRADYFTPITDDMLPHCWSILRCLLPSTSALRIDHVSYSPDASVIGAVWGDVDVEIALSRRSPNRVRRLSVEASDSASLDFSIEPGISRIGETEFKEQWTGSRPLERSLTSFIHAVTDSHIDWKLSAESCIDSVTSAEQASIFLAADQDRLLQELGRDLDDLRVVQTIVDRVAPTKNKLWPRMELQTEKDQQAAALIWSKEIWG